MKARFTITNDRARRTAHVRLTGIFTENDIDAFETQYQAQITAAYAGRPYALIADMRGLRTMAPAVAQRFGAAIGAIRRHGLVLCAHVSGETVQRLQALRLARQSSPNDTLTIDCETIDEARRVCEEAREHFDDAAFGKAVFPRLADSTFRGPPP